jgi:hypothetical protein
VLYLGMKQTLLTFLLITTGLCQLSAQSLTGTNGLFNIPSAYIAPDGYSYIGVSLYPKGYYGSFSGVYSARANDAMPSFVTLSLYDRVEFMFRYTHVLGIEVSPRTQYFPDRMFTLRYNALKEGKNHPAITIGLQDASEALGGTTASPYFLSTYFVLSKSFEGKSVTISPTVGYAYDVFGDSRPMIFDGVFAGIELSSNQFPYITAVAEYDSSIFNVALKTTVLGHLHFAVGLLDMQALSGFFSYRFNLSNR